MNEQGQAGPFAVGPNNQRAYWSLGALFDIRAAGSDTRGLYSLSEATMTKMAEPPLHVHHGEDEAWYVLEGRLTFHVGDQVLTAPAGTFVFAPKDIPHRFSVDVEPTRVLVITSPGDGFEMAIAEGGVAIDASNGPLPPDPDRLVELAEKYQFEILGLPPSA